MKSHLVEMLNKAITIIIIIIIIIVIIIIVIIIIIIIIIVIKREANTLHMKKTPNKEH